MSQQAAQWQIAEAGVAFDLATGFATTVFDSGADLDDLTSYVDAGPLDPGELYQASVRYQSAPMGEQPAEWSDWAEPVAFVAGEILASDSFTDTNGTAVVDHVGELGADWSLHGTLNGTGAKIRNGRVVNEAGVATILLASGVPDSADYDVEGDIYFASLITQYSGIVGRADPTEDTQYLLQARVDLGLWRLTRIVQGVSAELGSWADTFTAGMTRRLKLRMRGNTVEGIFDGVSRIGPIVDASISGPGRAGIRLGARAGSATEGEHHDNFLVRSATPPAAPAVAYHVNAATGSDTADGLTPATAWQTLDRVQQAVDAGLTGDTEIVLEAGQTFPGSLYVQQNLNATLTVRGSVPGGARPLIDVPAERDGLRIWGVMDVVVQDLDTRCTDPNSTAGWGIYADCLDAPTRMRSVTFQRLSADGFADRGITCASFDSAPALEDLEATNCRGGQGICIGFEGAEVHNATVRRLRALHNHGSPRTDLLTGNGIKLSVVDGTAERLYAEDNGGASGYPASGPTGISLYFSTRVTLTDSVAIGTRTSTATQADGGGFDIDGGCTDCVIDRCVSYDNDGPGFLVFGYAGAPNVRSVVRNVISIQDGRELGQPPVLVAGPDGDASLLDSPTVHNVTVYNSLPGQTDFPLLEVRWATNQKVYNNLLWMGAQRRFVELNSPAGTVGWDGNLYFNAPGTTFVAKKGATQYNSLAAWQAGSGKDAAGTAADPRLVDPAAVPALDDYDDAGVEPIGYRLFTDSPVPTAGVDLRAIAGLVVPGFDYFGHALVGVDPFRAVGAAAIAEVVGAQTVAPGFLADGSQVFAPTLQRAPRPVTAGFIAATDQVFAPVLTAGVTNPDAVQVTFIAATDQVFAPSVQVAPHAITAPLVADASQVFAPTVQRAPRAVAASFIPAADQVFAPTLLEGTPGPKTLRPGFIAATSQVFAPTVQRAPNAVVAGFIAATDQVFGPAVVPATHSVRAGFVAATDQVFAPTLVVSGHRVIPAFLPDTSQVFAPRLWSPGLVIPLQSLNLVTQLTRSLRRQTLVTTRIHRETDL